MGDLVDVVGGDVEVDLLERRGQGQLELGEEVVDVAERVALVRVQDDAGA